MVGSRRLTRNEALLPSWPSECQLAAAKYDQAVLFRPSPTLFRSLQWRLILPFFAAVGKSLSANRFGRGLQAASRRGVTFSPDNAL
jgi:hypothetical protein